MMNFTTTSALVATFFSASAMAEEALNIKSLPDEGHATIVGTVAAKDMADNDFTLRDANGNSIDIDIQEKTSFNVNKGDRVRVTGVMDTQMLGLIKEIDAMRVDVLERAATAAAAPASEAGSNNEEWHGGEYGAIDQLPDEGKVMLSGKVVLADPEEKRLTLEDQFGETIDVHTQANVNVERGDYIKVSGIKTDEMLGLGEQIVSASVIGIDFR